MISGNNIVDYKREFYQALSQRAWRGLDANLDIVKTAIASPKNKECIHLKKGLSSYLPSTLPILITDNSV